MDNNKPLTKWVWLWWLILVVFIAKMYYYLFMGGTFFVTFQPWYGYVWLIIGAAFLYYFWQYLHSTAKNLWALIGVWLVLALVAVSFGILTGGLAWTM